jgi:rRNA maturation endonuclease Nob1|tara:strand:+ start:1655 stop:1816 length:162 start_codon:yes stop_codon:yes gene_type:complete
MKKWWGCEDCGKEFKGKMRGFFSRKSPICPKCGSKETLYITNKNYGRTERIPD